MTRLERPSSKICVPLSARAVIPPGHVSSAVESWMPSVSAPQSCLFSASAESAPVVSGAIFSAMNPSTAAVTSQMPRSSAYESLLLTVIRALCASSFRTAVSAARRSVGCSVVSSGSISDGGVAAAATSSRSLSGKDASAMGFYCEDALGESRRKPLNTGERLRDLPSRWIAFCGTIRRTERGVVRCARKKSGRYGTSVVYK